MDLNALHPNQPLTIEEFASVVKSSVKQMKSLYRHGQLPPPSMRIGKSPRWTWHDVERFILRGGTYPIAPGSVSKTDKNVRSVPDGK